MNLEEKISTWRAQTLAGGIKSHVLLDELESHLRDEIEREMKLGLSLNEQEAFNYAVQKIGQAGAIKTEFERSKGFISLSAGRFASVYYNSMLKKHPVGFGAAIGMLLGIIIFAVGNSLTPDYLLLKAINAVQSPLIPIVDWIQGPLHGWGNNNTGIYKLLLVMMCYWTLIGLLTGFVCRLVFGPKLGESV